jgi:hypothetical protein
MFRARFFLQQYQQCPNELNLIPTDSISLSERSLWQRRLNLETNLHLIASQQEQSVQDDDVDVQFQEHLMNLYALFVLSPDESIKKQIITTLEGYIYQPSLFHNIFMHLYGGLIFWKAGKVTIVRDLLTRISNYGHDSNNNNGGKNEKCEFLLEKLYIMIQILLQKNLIPESQEILAQMIELDNDDILIELARIEILSQISTPIPDHDEDSELTTCCNDIISRYGQSLRPLVLLSLESIRQGNYRKAYMTLKQAREFCTQQGLPLSAEVQINSLICLHFRQFSSNSSLIPINNSTITFSQQQQQNETMIVTLENELKQAYPNHPYFNEKEQIIANINNIITQIKQ